MDITVLDFGTGGSWSRKAHSDTIIDLLEEPLSPDQCCCRWINIKQPSPDAVSILREYTGLENFGIYKRISKALLQWDSSSNGYVGVPFPILSLDLPVDVRKEPRTISSVQKEMLQECAYIISNCDNKLVTVFGTLDCGVDASIKAMISRLCYSHQTTNGLALLSAVTYSIVDRNVAMAMTCSETVKTLELYALTQPEEQCIRNAYLLLASIRGMQRSLRASVRLIEVLHTYESTRSMLKECERMVGVSEVGQSPISQTPRIKFVTFRCSRAISQLDASIEVLGRRFDHLMWPTLLERQRKRAQILRSVVWLLLTSVIVTTMLKLMPTR